MSSAYFRRKQRTFRVLNISDDLESLEALSAQLSGPEVERGLLQHEAVLHLRDDLLGGDHRPLGHANVLLRLAARLARLQLEV